MFLTKHTCSFSSLFLSKKNFCQFLTANSNSNSSKKRKKNHFSSLGSIVSYRFLPRISFFFDTGQYWFFDTIWFDTSRLWSPPSHCTLSETNRSPELSSNTVGTHSLFSESSGDDTSLKKRKQDRTLQMNSLLKLDCRKIIKKPPDVKGLVICIRIIRRCIMRVATSSKWFVPLTLPPPSLFFASSSLLHKIYVN